MRTKITAVVAAAALTITSFSTVMPTPAMADGNSIISQYGLPATAAEMDEARGGWVWIVARVGYSGARFVILRCGSSAQADRCARAVGATVTQVFNNQSAARRYTCSRWRFGC